MIQPDGSSRTSRLTHIESIALDVIFVCFHIASDGRELGCPLPRQHPAVFLMLTIQPAKSVLTIAALLEASRVDIISQVDSMPRAHLMQTTSVICL